MYNKIYTVKAPNSYYMNNFMHVSCPSAGYQNGILFVVYIEIRIQRIFLELSVSLNSSDGLICQRLSAKQILPQPEHFCNCIFVIKQV